jgi:hypothetical protein
MERSGQSLLRHRFDLLALAFLFLLPFVAHWNVFLTIGTLPRLYPYENDFIQTYNILSLTTRLLSEGEIGLWFAGKGFGTPYLADPLSGMLYPPSIILSKFDDPEQALLFVRFAIYMFMTKGTTACFFYLLMRGLGMNGWGSFAGAVAWGLNLRFDDIVRTAGAAHTLIWLPLLFLAAYMLVRHREKRYAAYFAIVFALTYFANYPAYFIFSAGFIALFCGFFLYEEYSGPGKRKPWRAGLYVGAAFALGAGLIAVQMLPSMEFTRHWNRASNLSLAETMIWQCAPSQTILGFFFPSLAYIERDHYLGILPLILAAVGLLSRDPKYRFKKLFVLTIVFTAIYSTKSAISHPLQKFVYDYVPIFGGLRSPARSLILCMFCLSALCGYGMDSLTRATLPRIRAKWIAIIAAAVLVTALIAVMLPALDFYTPSKADLYSYSAWAALSVLLSALLLWSAGKENRSRMLPLLALMVIAADLSLATYIKNSRTEAPVPYYLLEDPGIKGAKSLVTNHINEKYIHIAAMGRERVPRIDSLVFQPFLFLDSALPSSNGPYSAHGYEGSLLNINRLFIRMRDSRRARSILNTRFDVEYFLPRAFVVYQVEKLPHDDIMDEMLSPRFDPLNKHYIEEDLPEAFGLLSAGESEETAGKKAATRLAEISREARIVEYTDTLIRLETDTPRPGFLFLSDAHYPGWKAFVDGEPVKIYRTNYAFRGIPVPAGKHTIFFAYRPARFRIGLLVSVAALCIVLVILVKDRGRWAAACVVLLCLFCYGPLAWPRAGKQNGGTSGGVTAYSVQDAEGATLSIWPLKSHTAASFVHIDKAGVFDLLLQNPPQFYELKINDERAATIFNTGSESPAPQANWWEVQATLKLGKGNHKIEFVPVEPALRMKPVFRKFVPEPDRRDRYDIKHINIDPSFRIGSPKLVSH